MILACVAVDCVSLLADVVNVVVRGLHAWPYLLVSAGFSVLVFGLAVMTLRALRREQRVAMASRIAELERELGMGGGQL